MKKIPKIWLWASIGLFATSASCEKTVTPAIEQINSCTECGGTFDGVFKQEKVIVSYFSDTKEWYVKNDKFSALVPCKFPQELLVENKEFTFDGKYVIPIGRARVTRGICIEKIY
jgi:hypothetical protein